MSTTSMRSPSSTRSIAAGSRLPALLLILAIVGALVALTPAPAQASARQWAPAAQATIHPGVQTVTAGGQCTANFIYTGTDGTVYIGQSAHCASTGTSTATNGCVAESLPVGTSVTIGGAQFAGTLAYSSWVTMRAVGEADGPTCDFNDFALVRIDPADVGKVNPSVPVYGGPVGVTPTVLLGTEVVSYGNSGLRFEQSTLSPKRGTSLGQDASGWSHRVYTASPGIPGDSGSGFLDDRGRAFGALSTLTIAPLALSNGVADLSRALAYMEANTPLRVRVALGTVPFNLNATTLTPSREPTAPTGDRVDRLAGPQGTSRIETAVAVSQDTFTADGAGAVVLGRADVAADALAATPFAAGLAAPVLLTASDRLHDATAAEIDRVLPSRGTVYVLGGPNAIAPVVEATLTNSGYRVERIAGASRIETALRLADAVTDRPAQILLADGGRFQDALVAGPAAHVVGGVVLLTDGARSHPAVDAYLQQHADATQVTVGSVAGRAYPGRTAYAGGDDATTSVRVAEAYFAGAATAGVARVDVFADALAGAAHAARACGPILLTDREALSGVVDAYLRREAGAVARGVLYGGSAALSDTVQQQVLAAIS